MHHSDNKGLVLTPKVSLYQVVIVPIYMKKVPKEEMNAKCYELRDKMLEKGIRCHVDDRDNETPGFRYNHWEIRGIPIRLE